MAKRQPLYPHITKSRLGNGNDYRAETPTILRFMPDGPDDISVSMQSIGWGGKLAGVFQQAIARVRETR